MSNPVFAEVGGNSVQYYIAITITNSESSATPSPFQQQITVDSDSYSSYLASDLSNVNFQDGSGNILDSWLESGNSNTDTSTIYWVSFTDGIAASSSVTVYYCIYATSVNCFNTTNTGEAPQLSSTYGEYDNGTNVFLYYNVNPVSTTDWTISGTAGQISSAPSGSHFSTTNAFYANSASGDYMYTSISSLTSNIIISFNVYTTSLGDLFFLASSTGEGQMARLDGRGGTGDYAGLATTTSWTEWDAPTGIFETTDTWYKYDVTVSGTSAYAYIGSISNSLATFGTVTSSSSFSTTDYGDYLGLIGDGEGSSYITYWNGIIIRSYPPSGTMPSTSLSSINSNIITITYSSESSTESPISTTLLAGSLSQTIQYSEEETYSIPTLISNSIIIYKDLENTHIEAKADIIISYSESETEVLKYTYAVPTIQYSEQEQYFILELNPTASATGVLSNNVYSNIPFDSSSFPSSVTYNLYATYLPAKTNVQSVSSSLSTQIPLSFSFTVSASADTSTYVVTATVEDSASTPIPNATVNWTASGGTVSPTSSITNSSGEATTTASGASVTVTASATLLGVTETGSATT